LPTLNWIGKDAVIHHHKEVPFRLLKCRADLSVGDPDSGPLCPADISPNSDSPIVRIGGDVPSVTVELSELGEEKLFG
jgi:hypothetical protein